MTEEQGGDIIEAAKLLSGETLSGKLSGVTVTFTDGEIPSELERKLDEVYEFVAIKAITITLGEDVIPVGKEALFFFGHYLETGEELSRIEPVSEGVSMRYIGEVDVGHVLARHFHGTVSTETNEDPGG